MDGRDPRPPADMTGSIPDLARVRAFLRRWCDTEVAVVASGGDPVPGADPLPANEADFKRRLDEASRHISLDQLCVSPQCGFSSTVEGNDVAVSQERAKLGLCVDLAREVWGGV